MTKVSINELYDRYVISIEGVTALTDCKDPVSAAISIMTRTLIESILWAESDGIARLSVTPIDLNAEDINIVVEPYDGCKDELKTTIDTCTTGFSLIEENYPDYIRIG